MQNASISMHEWSVTESSYHPVNEQNGGTQFCTGNGVVGLRGSYEELGTKGVQGLFAAGVFRKSVERQFCVADTFCRKKYIFNEELMPTPEEIYIIQNLPDPLMVQIRLNGVRFVLWDGNLLDYRRTLDLQTGAVSRSVRWDDGGGNITSIQFKRFCSMAERHLIAQEITVTPENWSGEIKIESGIDASLNTEYKETVAEDHACGLMLKSEITGSGAIAYQAVEHRLKTDNILHEGWCNAVELRRYKKISSVNISQGQTLKLEKFSSVYSTQDEDPAEQALALVERSAESGFAQCEKENASAWAALWDRADIKIENDSESQVKSRFALFHLLIASPQEDSRISIGAKALTGQGYSGHVFWDTDINIAPFYQWVFPEWGGAHVRYRRRMLDGAKQYAASEGRSGARYPWQTSIAGFEHAPVAITCSRTQIHVSVDVAYCALRYADITGDTRWLAGEGRDIVIEVARYMTERVHYNKEQDRYEIHGVGGPDEYHPLTNNNSYTNWLTACVLRRAAVLAGESDETARWVDIAEKMYCAVDENTGLIPQCDGFFNLKDTWEISGSEWGGPGAEYHLCKGLKQPDVVLLLTLMPEKFGKKHLVANWDYYERFILHGSSLSPSIHSLVAARIGLVERAMHYFRLAAEFDFVDYNHDTAGGIHIGNMGGLWQAIAYGFAGLELRGDVLHFEPHLPEKWKSLSFKLNFRGNCIAVKVSSDCVSFAADPGNRGEVFVEVSGREGRIMPGASSYLDVGGVLS